MTLWTALCRLLSILTMAGLMTASMVPPSMASVVVAAAPATMEMATSMPNDMPCCPDQGPAVPDCRKGCPLAILCMGMCVAGASIPAASMIVRLEPIAMSVPGDDGTRRSRASPPPRKPPRL